MVGISGVKSGCDGGKGGEGGDEEETEIGRWVLRREEGQEVGDVGSRYREVEVAFCGEADEAAREP